MNREQLASTAQALVAAGKGILAADESSKTIQNRFDSIGLEATEDTLCLPGGKTACDSGAGPWCKSGVEAVDIKC